MKVGAEPQRRALPLVPIVVPRVFTLGICLGYRARSRGHGSAESRPSKILPYLVSRSAHIGLYSSKLVDGGPTGCADGAVFAFTGILVVQQKRVIHLERAVLGLKTKRLFLLA